MKKLSILLIALFLITSCEDVVEVDLNDSDPRLVIDASINWFKGTTGNEQTIKLSLTTPFFSEEEIAANDAIVLISDINNNTYNFIENGSTGFYKNNTFVPQIEQQYFLTVTYNNETYTATETLKSVVSIDEIEQKNDGGFQGQDIELKALYTDPIETENYYFFEFIAPIGPVPELEVYEDRFTNGNQIFGFFTDEDLEPGMEITIRNYGISQRFYQFMFTLLLQSEGTDGPFATQPATVRGNIINNTNADNYPFGYFRLSEVDEVIYTIE